MRLGEIGWERHEGRLNWTRFVRQPEPLVKV